MKIKFLILSCLILFCLQGCFFLPRGLKTLKSVGSSQNKIEAYLVRQSKLFKRLLRDLNNKRLRLGSTKRRIVRRYGEPVVSKIIAEPLGGERLLYRQPTEYFKSEKVYLYFDRKEKLSRWEYKPEQKLKD